jgi:hypothetical protein
MKNVKTIYSFDFDDTLFFSPRPEEGKTIYEEKTGNVWPYNGWWSKAETLDTDLFYVPINQWVLSKYKESLSDVDSLKIVATGRLEKVENMRKNVENIINSYGLSFDNIYLNTMGDTFRFKIKLFTDLIKMTKCEKFIMYDDRHEHLVKFEDWAVIQPCEVVIVDVKNKVTKIYS